MDDARPCYNSLMRPDPKLAARVYDLIRKAEGYLMLEMHREALRQADEALALTPRSFAALYLRGEALRGLGRFSEALVPLRRALRMKPDAAAISVAIGWCLKRTGKLDRAIATMRAALRHEPDSPILCYNLACYLAIKDRKPEALRLLGKAVTLDTDFAALSREEPDFDNLRRSPEFDQLTGI